jgi:pectin methylesterase-like acyl-CoA thioesterase
VTAVDGSENVSPMSDPESATPIKVDIVVAADGSGDATTIQAVLGTPLAGNYDAANPGTLANNADYSAQGYRTILVKPGTYTGPFVSGNRYGVRLVGATGDPRDVVLTAPGGAIATFAVAGSQWTFRDLTLESVATSAGAQATALQVKGGDKTIVDNARLLGDGKLFLASTGNTTTYGRIYVHDSFLQGGGDMLLGRAVLVIDRSRIHMLDRPWNVITDSSINAAHPFGFLITDSTITSDAAAGTIYLGRPYPESGVAQAQVVVRNTELPAAIVGSQPWKDYSGTVLWTSGRFFEYNNTGAGAGSGANRPQLSDTDAAGYTAGQYLAGTDGWNPVP